MPIDQSFLSAVAPLLSPSMGTDVVAHLLYALVRFHRPFRCLEIGAGYTTPFILQALAENATEAQAELAALAAGQPDERRPYLRPAYPEETAGKAMTLLCLDDISHPKGRAARVGEVARALALDGFLEFHDAAFQGYSRHLGEAPLDFVWFDCGSYRNHSEFLAEYLPRVNPDGGLVLIHSTLTNVEGLLTLKTLKLKQLADFGALELVSLLEPHKSKQNSLTLLRVTRGERERIYGFSP